jgi:nucleoside-diphosphate-sugar epimerase
MNYLVLGSSGQIGSSLCSWLTAQGHIVQPWDIQLGDTYDLRVPNEGLRAAMAQADFVFFLAWDVGGSQYLAQHQDSYDFVMNNVAIMHTVFAELAVSKKPFIFTSSQMANMSHSSYGLTKHLGEKLTAALSGITVKLWNVYGIEREAEKTHVITDFINSALRTSQIKMRTDGTESRQMLYADDCSECLEILSQQYDSLPRHKPYHITSFSWHTIREIADIIALEFGGISVSAATATDVVQQDKRNEPDPWILNYWQPRTALTQGIHNIIKHIKEKQ